MITVEAATMRGQIAEGTGQLVPESACGNPAAGQGPGSARDQGFLEFFEKTAELLVVQIGAVRSCEKQVAERFVG